MDDNTIVNTEETVTGTVDAGQENQSQEDGKTFTQDQVNDIVAKRLQQANKKFEGVDMTEYQQLKELKERVEDQELMDRKDFDTLLKKTRDKYTSEVTTLKGELESIKIDGALIDAASKLRSIAPEQTAQLLRNSVKLDAAGKVVIMDGDTVRYTDEAEPMTVDQLVTEFLDKNTYFRASGPSGTDSTGNSDIVQKTQPVDISQLDMTNPAHREEYRKLKQAGKL